MGILQRSNEGMHKWINSGQPRIKISRAKLLRKTEENGFSVKFTNDKEKNKDFIILRCYCFFFTGVFD